MQAEHPKPVHTGMVEYSDGETGFEGYVAAPRGKAARRPCVVLSHDWSGLNAPIMRLAERYASLGYVCFALDAYGKGTRGDPLGDNGHLMNPLMDDRARLGRRLLAGYEAARHLPGVDGARMAAAGYCFGGLCALDLARLAAPDLRAAISIHGGLQPPPNGGRRRIDASILLLHGWADPIVPTADLLSVTGELTAAGADWQLHAYGHAQHAFTFKEANLPERGIAYHRKADERAWAAIRAHLAASLGEAAWQPHAGP